MNLSEDTKAKIINYLGLVLLLLASLVLSLDTINITFLILGFIWPMSIDTYYQDSDKKKYRRFTFLNLILRYHDFLEMIFVKESIWQIRLIYFLSPLSFCLLILIFFNVGNLLYPIIATSFYLILQEVIFKVSRVDQETHQEIENEQS